MARVLEWDKITCSPCSSEVGAAGLGVFLREGLRLDEAPGSSFGANLIQASCSADREIEVKGEKSNK